MAEPLAYTNDELEAHLKWKLEHKEFVIQFLDKRVQSPQACATKIYNEISKLEMTNWEALIGCAEIIGMFLPQFKQLESPVRDLLKLAYSAHYMYLHNDKVSIDELQSEYAKLREVSPDAK